jgi:peptide deformylase
MALLDIVAIPEPVLRQKARKVSDFGPELQTLIDNMIETMRAAPGVGLAAPQVDKPLRVIVVEYAEQEEEEEEEEENNHREVVLPKLYTIVNPEIVRFSQDTEIGTEGCLSVPNFVGDVERAQAITVKGYNRRGQPMRVKAEGWLARIFQHEIDHLDGVLFIDRAERVWKTEEKAGQAIPAD